MARRGREREEEGGKERERERESEREREGRREREREGDILEMQLHNVTATLNHAARVVDNKFASAAEWKASQSLVFHAATTLTGRVANYLYTISRSVEHNIYDSVEEEV
jgi:hypothetical protein